MGIEFFFVAVILLALFAVFDLVVGVSNDAVNFLNSSIGSRVAPRHIIMIIASLGILAGVTFSSGMMEVARKGIFHPHLFTMPDLLFIFLAVMLTDVILLDLFNTYGMPTSTTVSIVFELLGAAVAVSSLKIVQSQATADLGQYINTGRALVIIGGILLSVAVAFVCGAIVQLLSRLLFTFDYTRRLKRYGALWGGLALAFITYFILVKGAKGTSFIPPETAQWITSNTGTIFLIIFPASVVILQALLLIKVNILKPIVLIGTFALAMAFAANDLVNFIGVPMAGFHAYQEAASSGSPLTATMEALGQKVPTETYLLLFAGLIMVITLWISRKARTVTETEINLSQQEEGEERFESSSPSRIIVTLVRKSLAITRRLIPPPLLAWSVKRLDTSRYPAATQQDNQPKFDLLRASVNLMVASAVISYATSQKLPLSTTYVTFMVAMGTSFADQAWGRESAVYRVSGVLAVISGWFMTALLAFTVSALFATAIFFGGVYGAAIVVAIGAIIIWRNRGTHIRRRKALEMDKVFNLKKVSDLTDTLYTTFEHIGYLLHEINTSLNAALQALFMQDGSRMSVERRKTKKIQQWGNIIIANVYKAMRLMQREELEDSYRYGQTTRRLQKLVDGHRDIVMRSYLHVQNHHSGLLEIQIEEIRKVKEILSDILIETGAIISSKKIGDTSRIEENAARLRQLAKMYHESQLERIRTRESKTRLSIMFYAIVGDAMMLSKQCLKLLEIYNESFVGARPDTEFDID